MRIALLTNFVPPYRVPVFRAVRERAGELRVFVSTPMEQNRSWTPQWGDLDVVVQKTRTFVRQWRHERFTEPYELHVPFDTIPQLRRWRPDVVVTAEFGLRSAQALVYGRAARVPVIVWATLADHLESSRGRARAAVRRLLVRGVAAVIVNGEAGARYIRRLGAPDAKAVRIPQTIELAPFADIPLQRDPLAARRFLYCGALTERKGVDLLIDGVVLWGREHPDERLALTVLGDGPLRQRIARATLPPNVGIELMAAVQYGELPRWYARSGILLFPSRGDEWGLVVNEAMAAGMPVLGSVYAQAVEEMVADGANGWRFRPNDAGAVAAAIARALATPDRELEDMRRHARATALRNTPDTIADRIVSLARAVVQ